MIKLDNSIDDSVEMQHNTGTCCDDWDVHESSHNSRNQRVEMGLQKQKIYILVMEYTDM